MRLWIHNKPKLKMPEFKVDEPLSKHLDDPLLSNMINPLLVSLSIKQVLERHH